jgi:ATP-dependent DNA helicase PIF1
MLDKMNNEVQVETSSSINASQVKSEAATTATTATNHVGLNVEQQTALKAVAERRNVFISGPGGTGKSFLIKYIKDNAPAELKVAVTALTGCAAILLGCGAKTLHSWAGIGLGKESAADIITKIVKRKKNSPGPYRAWTKTDVLIIDEISMMSAELFEKLNSIGQALRKSARPFGGMQIVALGDFFQLPPVVRDLGTAAAAAASHLAFNAPSWAETFETTVQLRTIVRQTDPVFQELLNSFRVGDVRADHVDLLKSRMNLNWDELEIKPTLLFPRRAEVDQINNANLLSLEGESYTYAARTELKTDVNVSTRCALNTPEGQQLIERFDNDAPYNSTEKLTIGAQVMLIYNKDQDLGLVNGSRGVITRFVHNDKEADDEKIPVVKFKNGLELPIRRHTWEMETLAGVCRSQIPLRLAYAITIHKSQGASLDCALIDCGPSVWEWGQAYVALSRVRSLEGLYMFAFDRRAVKAHPVVKAYYKRLEAAAIAAEEE